MGVIGAATPGSDYRKPVPRATNMKLENLTKVNKTPNKYYDSSNLNMKR